MDNPCLSPGARYEVRLLFWEAAASQWVQSPQLRDRGADAPLFQFSSDQWSVDDAVWESESRVRLILRKFPGNHTPGDLAVTVDCESRSAVVGDLPSVPLEALEDLMERQLVWR